MRPALCALFLSSALATGWTLAQSPQPGEKPRVGEVSGVLHWKGKPHTGTTLKLVQYTPRKGDEPAIINEVSAPTTASDDAGRFVFKDVAPRTYWLAMPRTRIASKLLKEVKVVEGGKIDVGIVSVD
jgi:hypothetical protein